MAKDKSITKRHREFLNEKFGLAAVQWTVDYNEYTYEDKQGKEKTDKGLAGDVTISDCNRSITLSFHCGKGDKGVVTRKMDRLIRALEKFREQMTELQKKL